MPRSILVIGAAHLDIVGEYSGPIAAIDKPGQIVYSVGGTAYNIAVNLAQNGAKVAFMTLLKAESLVQPIILARLASYGIDTSHVVVSDTAEESGFIAERRDGVLVSAVTASTMEVFHCPEEELRQAMKTAAFVVVDCNVTATFLNRVQRLAADEGKRLVVACVSERKALRSQQTERRKGQPFPFFALSMNEEEAAALDCAAEPPDEAQAVALCRRLGAENVIVTRGASGWLAFNNVGEVASFPAPVLSRIVSVTGGGDALLAAFCLSLYQRGEVDWPDVDAAITRLVSEVLSVPGGTVGARTNPHEMRVVPKAEIERLRALEREKVFRVFGEPVRLFGKTYSMDAVAAVLGIAVAVLSLGYQVWKDVMTPAPQAGAAAASTLTPPSAE